jgi:flagellar protein FliS
MEQGNVAARGEAISKAIQIIDEGLKAALIDKGDGLAANLRTLYEYMGCRLLVASLKNDGAALEEVTRLLTEIKDAWNAIDPSKR